MTANTTITAVNQRGINRGRSSSSSGTHPMLRGAASRGAGGSQRVASAGKSSRR
jgi:hypothetical protein